jgi:PAS domain S-box-containing protein
MPANSHEGSADANGLAPDTLQMLAQDLLGTWEVDVENPGAISFNARCRILIGLNAFPSLPFKAFREAFDPAFWSIIDQAFAQALSTDGDNHVNIICKTHSGGSSAVPSVHLSGALVINGTSVKLCGVALPAPGVDESPFTEKLATAAIEGSSVGLFHINFSDDAIEYSPAFSTILTGGPSTQLTRADFIRHVHPDDLELRAEAYRNAMHTGDLSYVARTVWKDGTVRWIRNVGTVVFDAQGSPGHFSGTVQDITEEKEKEFALKEARDLFRIMVEQAPVAICLMRGRDLIVETANLPFLAMAGKDAGIIGIPLLEGAPELCGQPAMEVLYQVLETGEPFNGYDVPVTMTIDGREHHGYYNITYSPLIEGGTVTGILQIAVDVTRQVKARRALEESEARFRSLIEEATVATCLYVGRELRIEVANDLMLSFWGKGQEVVGMKLKDAVPELEGQPFLEILDNVFTSGVAYIAKDTPAMLHKDGIPGTYYFDFTYKPLFNAQGSVYAIMNMATDVTEQVIARLKLEESELFARNILYHSPVAKLVLIGQQMVIRSVNKHMLDIIGRDDSIVGQKLLAVLPELGDTETRQRLLKVLTTGETFNQPEERIQLVRHGQPYTGYYNHTYKVLTNTRGEHYGVLATAVEVTDHVQVRKDLEASKDHLKSLVESAPFPIGVYYGKDMIIELANTSMLDVWGKGHDVIGKSYRAVLPELQDQEVFQQLDDVLTTGRPFHKRHQRILLEHGGAMETFYFN